MKKFIIGVLSVLVILSTGFVLYNIQNVHKINVQIVEKKADIKKVQEEISSKEQNIKNNEDTYQELENQNKEKVEEYEKWKKEVQKIKDLLS